MCCPAAHDDKKVPRLKYDITFYCMCQIENDEGGSEVALVEAQMCLRKALSSTLGIAQAWKHYKGYSRCIAIWQNWPYLPPFL